MTTFSVSSCLPSADVWVLLVERGTGCHLKPLFDPQASACASGKHASIRSRRSISQYIASSLKAWPLGLFLSLSLSYINLSPHSHHSSSFLNGQTQTASEMLSSKFISASVYNDLPSINDNQAIPHATLRALGQLFTASKVEQLVGVGLLHKHFELAPHTIMVHDGLVCKPASIENSVGATGTSFFWDGTKFQAFEYAQGEPLNLPSDFLVAFAGYLESHRLSGHVSLSKLDGSATISARYPDHETNYMPAHVTELERDVSHSECHQPGPGRKLFMERLDPTTNSHIMQEAPYILPRDATQWIFEGDVPVITYGCARLSNGQGGYTHKKKVRYFRHCWNRD